MEGCPQLTDDHVSTFVLFLENAVTIITLVLWIRTARKTVDISHPMYGLLYQELIILAVFVSLNLIVLIVLKTGEVAKMIVMSGIYVFIHLAALQFHQVTCVLPKV